MINTIKKRLQYLFKLLGYNLFYLINGKIIGFARLEENHRIVIESVKTEDNIYYKLYKIFKGRIYTDTINDTAIIDQNKLVVGPSFQIRKENKKLINGNPSNNIVFEKGTPRIKKKLKGKVLSLLTGGAGNSSYWHWLFDVLPRIKLVSHVLSIETIDFFLLPSTKKKFQKQTLEYLSISENKWLQSDEYRHIQADEIISTEHPYVIKNNPTDEIQNMPLWIIHWLKKNFLKNLKKDNKKFAKKFYIDRSDAKSNTSHYRGIINENEIREFLKKNDYAFYTLAELDFLDQVRLFNNAESIIGLHGAGFSNLVFCEPGTKVLEFKSETAGDVIGNLAKKNKLIFNSITEPIDTSHRYVIKDNQMGYLNIPMDLVKKIVL